MCPIHSKSNRDHSRLKLATFRMKSFLWMEKYGDEPLGGFGFVADFSEVGVGLYVSENIKVHSNVRMSFESQDSTTYKGVVIWSQRYSLEQHFVGHKALSYRIGIKFLFGTEAERRRYVEYYHDVKNRVLAIKPGLIF